MNDVSGKTRMEETVACFMVFSQHVPGESEGNHKPEGSTLLTRGSLVPTHKEFNSYINVFR
jgi:hypothetical protein